VSEPSLEMDLK